MRARFEHGFDPGRSIPADANQLVPPAGVFLVARSCGQPLGCGALKTGAGSIGEIKRMWVAPAARGQGVGRRLLEALEGHARHLGLAVLHLETNRTLHEAQALYRRHGYREVAPFNAEPYAHHWFEKRLDRSSAAIRRSRQHPEARPRAGAGASRREQGGRPDGQGSPQGQP